MQPLVRFTEQVSAQKGRKCCDPDAVFRVFGEFCDYEVSEV